jgi:hypothetical protein
MANAYRSYSTGIDPYVEIDLVQQRMNEQTQMLRKQMEDMAARMMRQEINFECDYEPKAPQKIARAYDVGAELYNSSLSSGTTLTTNGSWSTSDHFYDVNIKCDSCGEEVHEGDWDYENYKCSNTLQKESDEVMKRSEEEQQKHAKNFQKVYWHRRMMNPELFETN